MKTVHDIETNASSGLQHTLRNPIGCVGTGLHSGVKVELSLRPAAPDTGIRFRRTDLDGAEIQADQAHVEETVMCTTIGEPGGAKVATIEHLMAALSASGIDNAVIEVGGSEVPIMDGSAQPFLFLIDCAGISAQQAPRRTIEILKPVAVSAHDKFARLEPAPSFEVDCSICFDHPVIRSQSYHLYVTRERFRSELASARTFGFAERVEDLWARGLALGGSLKNAVVVSKDRVLNEEGLRFPDEFVRHKALDAIGDLYLAGAPIRGRFVGYCAGHALHVKLLRALFRDPTAWRWGDTENDEPAFSERLVATA